MQPEITFPYFNGLKTSTDNLKIVDYKLDENDGFKIDLIDF